MRDVIVLNELCLELIKVILVTNEMLEPLEHRVLLHLLNEFLLILIEHDGHRLVIIKAHALQVELSIDEELPMLMVMGTIIYFKEANLDLNSLGVKTGLSYSSI